MALLAESGVPRAKIFNGRQILNWIAEVCGAASKVPVGRLERVAPQASREDRPDEMTSEVSSFICSTFRSAWSVELLLFLKRNRERSWSHAEIVAALRGSDLVVSQGAEAMLAAGLVLIEEDGLAR